MKVLINDHLDDHHLTQIQSTSEDVDLVIPDSSGDALDVMPEIDIIFGGMSRDMFKRAESLKWVQTWGAGVDGMMYAEFVHSEVILTSAKGTVGCSPVRTCDGSFARVDPGDCARDQND